jgi:iron complex outermembrane receptor protein
MHHSGRGFIRGSRFIWLYASLMLSCGPLGLLNAAEQRQAIIEEVLVTATKQEAAAQDLPIAITALTTELESPSIRNLTDLNGYAPNMIFGADGSRGGGGANVNIRGISPTRSDDNSFDAPIAVMIDDIYLGTLAGQVLENFDLERVEILRGPQGTLFGKNTVGGVINVIRTRPTGELGGRFQVTLGDDDQQEVRAVLNTPLAPTLALKLFATDVRYDGHMENRTTGHDVADREYQNMGATFLWEPTDTFEMLLTAELFRDEGTLDAFHTNYNVAPGVLPAPPPGSPEADYSGGFVTCLVFGTCRTSLKTPSKSEHDKDNAFELDTDALTMKLTWDLNENLSLVSVTGYRDVDEYRIFDFDASAAPFITIERFNEYDQFSQELRLDGQFENVTFTAGLYYFENEFEQDWITGDSFWHFVFSTFVPGVSSAADPFWWGLCQAGGLGALSCDPGLTSVPLTDNVTQILYETQKTTSYAAFAQMDYRFAERWILTAGIRWTYEEKDFLAGQAYLSNVARQRLRVFPRGYADLSQDWTDTSPKIGLTYEINDSSMIYASYSEGFHSGGFFGVNQNIADFERDQYDPETAKSYEVGYKSQHFDNRLLLNITYFYNDFENKQESFVVLDPTTNTVATQFNNVATVIYQGWELETQFVLNEYLRAFFNYGYLDAEYDEFVTDLNPEDGVQIEEDATHLNPRNAPEFTWAVGGTLSIPFGNGAFELFAKYTRIDEVDTNLLNLEQAKIDEREDLTATIGYYAENWSVAAFGRNLTDERFETFFPIATLFAAGNVNRPRTYGMEFTYQF